MLIKDWLNRSRVIAFSLGFIFLFIILTCLILSRSDFVDPNGLIVFADFRTLWSASYLVTHGRAADVYDPSVLNSIFWSLDPYRLEVNSALVDPQNIPVRFVWLYPPTYLLMMWSASLLPFATACIVYLIATFTAYVYVIKKNFSDNVMVLVLVAFPGVWMNFRLAQNGFLITALFGGALLLLPKYPRLSGAFIGALCIKPHLAMMWPVALLAIGAWQTLFSALATGLFFVGASVYFFGPELWEGWFSSLYLARQILETAQFHWNYSPSVFAFMSLLGAPLSLAYGAHIAIVILLILIVWKVWRSNASWPMRQSILVFASLLVSPYIMDYDLTLLALPIALIATQGMKYGWLPSERRMLALLWMLPILMVVLASATSFQIGPIVILVAVFTFLRRAMINQQNDC
ncbi:glycosyltransferase family 87 protein [Polynucleobacter arcticus]|uniref:DUF2029 domain-containing protein n=1 Tax=Polynucleobacter arcticus TaxID=1743165 RepID=A0A6M9PL88_9BURK|nr:glycosyltransferase family 87 protein [Polynucleobacter arcticus]QKM60078.1 hypothetical protein DN92_02955 [Polynucleobacter arcticus]